MNDIPVRPRRPGKHTLTKEERAKLKAQAVNGVISFDDYIKTINQILNEKK